MDPINRRVAQRIRVLRKRRKLSQQDLADAMDRSVDAISALERGKSLPGFETLVRLARAMNVPIREFVDFDAARESPKRAALMAAIVDVARSMPDKDLSIALKQLEALAQRGK